MDIKPIQNSQYYSTKPAFKSWSREVYKNSPNPYIKELLHRNDTWFFRDSEFWAKLTTFFVERFKNVPKVNVYSYGCSDGSEPFTFAMRMLSMHEEKDARKFLPVIAKDYDKEAIKRAKSCNSYFLLNTEKIDIDYYTQGCYNRFFTESNNGLASINPELYNSVKFSVADMSKDYKKIKPENTIVMARNFWPYIEKWWERQNILRKLGNQLGENSFLVIGEFDIRGTNWHINNEIVDAGFKHTPIEYVFEKDNVQSPPKDFLSSLRRLF